MALSMDTTVKSMRSLLNSMPGGLTERQLRKEFREMEGCDIPYKSFGFSSLLDFLRASNQFDLTTTNEGIHVRAKVTQSSLHVVQNVATQNKSKSQKKRAKTMAFVPRLRNNLAHNYHHQFRSNAPRMQPAQRQMSFAQSQRKTFFANNANRNNSGCFANNTNLNNNNNSSYLNYNSNNNAQHLLQLQQHQQIIRQQQQKQLQQQYIKPKPIEIKPTRSNAENVGPKTNAQVNRTSNDQYRSAPPAPPNNVNNGELRQKSVNSKPNDLPTTSKPKHSISDRLNPNFEVKRVAVEPVQFATKAAPRNDVNISKKIDNDSDWDPTPPPSVQPSKSVAQPANENGREQIKRSSQTPAPDDDKMPKLIGMRSTLKSERLKGINSLSKGVCDNQPAAKVSVFDRLGPIPNDRVKSSVVDRLRPPLKSNDRDQQLNSVEKKMQGIKIDSNASRATNENDPKVLLERYCTAKGYDAPAYKFRSTRFKKFIGTVRVEGIEYTTEPIEYDSKLNAENAAAARALECVKEYPISHDSHDEIARKIFEMIGTYGIILKYIPNVFEQKYEQSLPEEWPDIIESRSEMFLIDGLLDSWLIVFRNASPKSTDAPKSRPLTTNQSTSTDEDFVDFDSVDLPALHLPWDEPNWNIEVTNVTSPIDIWGRINDTQDWIDLSAALEKLEDRLRMGCLSLQMCEHVNMGDICLTKHVVDHSNGYDCILYRVHILDVDAEKKLALCFYIDDGYQEWLEYDSLDTNESVKPKLYRLDRHLLKYPPQTIHFSLFNVEDFAENAVAKREIVSRMIETNFVARIKSTESEFQNDLDASDSTPRIRAIFRGTLGENVNKDILQEICDQAEKPRLDTQKRNIVRVTHVSDNGDIYCRFHGCKDMHLIDQIMHRMMDKLSDAYRVDATTLRHSGPNVLFLVFDKAMQRCYRAKIVTEQHDASGNMVTCLYVDYGLIKSVEHDDIYDLSRLSVCLSKYPHQAIVTRLYGIEPYQYTKKIIDRLLEILSSNKAIYFDVAKSTDIPYVKAWKVGNPLSINELIRRESEMEIKPEMVPLPDSDGAFSDDEDIDLPLHPMPEINRVCDATVITAINPEYFFVRLNSKEPIFMNMQNYLWKECEDSKEILTIKDIKLKQFYAGRFSDGVWRRVKVQSLQSNEAVVFKWDFGDVDQLSIDALRPLDSVCRSSPQAIFCARLYGIEPHKNVWDKDDCAQFKQLTVGKSFKIQVKRIQKERDSKKYVAELTLIGANNVNIAEQMVQQRRAKYI